MTKKSDTIDTATTTTIGEALAVDLFRKAQARRAKGEGIFNWLEAKGLIVRGEEPEIPENSFWAGWKFAPWLVTTAGKMLGLRIYPHHMPDDWPGEPPRWICNIRIPSGPNKGEWTL